MNQPQQSSRKKDGLPLRGLHTVPEQGHDVEASAHSQGSGASRRKKENSSSEATSATKSSSRPSSERRHRHGENQEAAYDDKQDRRRTRQEEEEVRRQRQFMRQEEDSMRRASRAQSHQYSERVPRIRPDDPRFYAARDPHQARRYADVQEDYYVIEEPRRESSVARRVYVEPERVSRRRTHGRSSELPVGPRSNRASSARLASAYAEAPRLPRDSSYYFDDFEDDSFTSFDDSYYYPEDDDFMPPPLEERVYVDSSGRPYRVIAPVEPRRLYRPGRDYLTTPIPPPTRSLMRPVGYHRPSSSRVPYRDYIYDSSDRYRQQRPRGASRRIYAEDEYEEFEREQGEPRRGIRYARASRRVAEEPDRRRERPSARISLKKPPIAGDTIQASADGRESTVRRTTARKPCIEVVEDDADKDGVDDDDDSRIQEMPPRDQRGRLPRRHSIGSAHSREQVLEDMQAVQLEKQREHSRHHADAPQRRTVQGRLESSSSQFVEWAPPPSTRRQKPKVKERDFYSDSHDPRPLQRSSSNPSLDSASYFEGVHSASMGPVRDMRPYCHDEGYVEEHYRPRGQLRFQRRHSFGSMSEHTMDRSYMEESYPSVF